MSGLIGVGILVLFLPCISLAQTTTQHSTGDCSPNIAQATGKIVISCNSQSGDPLNDVSFNYMRLFGAAETSVVARMWKDGITLERSPYGNTWRIPGSAPVTDDLARFFSKWEYAKAKPIYNSLWSKLTDDNYVIRNYFTKTLDISRVSDIEECITNLYGGGDAPTPKNCNKNKSKDIGYLFLLIENLSDHPITNVVFSFVSITSTNDTSRLPINISNIFTYSLDDSAKMLSIMKICKERSGEQLCQNLEEKVIPVMRPHDQFVFPIFVYKKQMNNEFSGNLLDDSLIPFGISLSSGGKRASGLVRPPLRNEAARVILPTGWYYQ